MLEIYCAYNDCFNEQELREQYLHLSPYRRKIVDEHLNEVGKRQRIVAGMLLERAIYDRGYNPMAGYELSSRGKPYLKLEKCGQETLQFSLSHSKKLSACVTSSYAVGIDVEQVGRGNPSMAERFFSPQEVKELNRLPKEEWDRMFMLCWTAKEAITKCLDLPLPVICQNTDFSEMWQKMGKETCEVSVITDTKLYLRSFFMDDSIITCASGKDGLFSLKRIDK